MSSRNRAMLFFFTCLFLLFNSSLSNAAMNLNETLDLKEDGSGNMTISYLEKTELIKSKNFMIGNIPFNESKVKELFTAPNTTIFSSTIGESPKDNSLTVVTVVIGFKKVTDLNSLPALKGISYDISRTDTGTVFVNTFSQEFLIQNSINQVFAILKSADKIKSTNGQIAEGGVRFFRGSEFLKNTDVRFIVTLDRGGATTTKSNGEEGKSCGLFGLELPLIMLAGLVFSGNLRRNKTKV